MYQKEIMEETAKRALFNSSHQYGGPFGAAVVKDGKIICIRTNTVLSSVDCTCHAEMNAIRQACTELETYDLSGCELYTTGYPCPMCLGAIMWSNIKKVYVSGLLEDAEKIGFKDKNIYETIDKLKNSCYNIHNLELEFVDRKLAQNLYSKYEEQNGIIY